MAKIRFPISSKCRPLLKRLDVRMLFLSMKANELSQSSYKWSNLEHSQPGAPKFFTQIKFIFYQKFLILHRRKTSQPYFLTLCSKNQPNQNFLYFSEKTYPTKTWATKIFDPAKISYTSSKISTQSKFLIRSQKTNPLSMF